MSKCPSNKQIKFAKAISECTRIHLPTDFTAYAYFQYIARNKDKMYEFDEYVNDETYIHDCFPISEWGDN